MTNNANKVPRWFFRYVGTKTFDFSSKKRQNLARNWHFCPLLAHLVPCWWVGWWLWRGLYLARHLFTLSIKMKGDVISVHFVMLGFQVLNFTNYIWWLPNEYQQDETSNNLFLFSTLHKWYEINDFGGHIKMIVVFKPGLEMIQLSCQGYKGKQNYKDYFYVDLHLSSVGYANLSFLWYSPKRMHSLLDRLVFQKLIFWLSTHTSFVLFVHCSPLFAVAPDLLHQLNGGLWFHGNFHLHLHFKSSSTNLCVADKGKAETIFVTFCLPHDMIFFIFLKTSKHSSFSLSTKIVPYAFRVPKCAL